MSKFYLLCARCKEISLHPLYEVGEYGETVWNTRKNAEFLEKHRESITRIRFILEDTKELLVKMGHRVQQDTKD